MDRWTNWHCTKKRLRRSAWRQALYVDFEGRAVDEESPVLLGVLHNPDGGDWAINRFVFDSACTRAAAVIDDGTKPASYDDAFDWLLRLEADRRPIVSWSCHDIRWIKRLTSGAAFRHRNAIQTARRKVPLPGPRDNRLQRYLDAIGYQRPDQPIDVGRTIQQIRTTASVTDTVQQRWRQLTLHNDHDLLGMREVLRKGLGIPPGDDVTISTDGRVIDPGN